MARRTQAPAYFAPSAINSINPASSITGTLTLLLAAIVFFEIDIRLLSDWRIRAAASPWWPAGVLTSLGIHLVFAVTTFGLWVWTVWEAVARFPVPPRPAAHGARHRRLGRLAALDLVATAITGLAFYWLAFVA